MEKIKTTDQFSFSFLLPNIPVHCEAVLSVFIFSLKLFVFLVYLHDKCNVYVLLCYQKANFGMHHKKILFDLLYQTFRAMTCKMKEWTECLKSQDVTELCYESYGLRKIKLVKPFHERMHKGRIGREAIQKTLTLPGASCKADLMNIFILLRIFHKKC